MSKRALSFTAVTLLLCGLSLEMISLGGLKLYEKLNPGSIIDHFIERHFDGLDEAYYKEYLGKAHHPVLGWDNQPGSELTSNNTAGEAWTQSFNTEGARKGNPLSGSEPDILTYGDSFTLGAEVNGDETWQAYLSQTLQRNVVNYGVNGYGTGQALLKFEQHLTRPQTASTVILGIHEFNIARVVNGFRPFTLPATGAKLGFKPAFVPAGDEVRFHPNPFRADTAFEDLRAAAYEVAAYDFWARRKITLRWPYTVQLLKLAYRTLRPLNINNFRDLWRSEAGQQVMRHVVARFVAAADRHDIRSVLLFIPNGDVLKNDLEPVYAGFIRTMTREHPGLTIVDVSRQELAPEKFHVEPFLGHASAYGNRMIAAALAQALAQAPAESPAKAPASP